jgi:predicted N-acetyltransferase YhbS
MIEVIVRNGNELSKVNLDTINFWRRKEFNSNTEWNDDNAKAFYDSVVFLLKENEEILAFGRLKPISIYIDDQEHKVMGIAAIISIIKGKGYGKKLVQEISNYLKTHNLTGIGFCGAHITPFYQKCGFQIIKNGQRRFIYIDDNDQKHQDEKGDVIYQTVDNGMLKLLENKGVVFTHYVPYW